MQNRSAVRILPEECPYSSGRGQREERRGVESLPIGPLVMSPQVYWTGRAVPWQLGGWCREGQAYSGR